MKLINLNRVAGAALAALVTFAAAPSYANQGEVTHAPDAYRIFISGQAPASTSDVADGGYGSQGFHHGLPETSIVPGTEPVGGCGSATPDEAM